MKVSLIHDYLREYGGAEKVLESLNEVWPSADIFTSTYEEEKMDKLGFTVPKGLIHTNSMQNLPFRYSLRKHYFFLYPLSFKLLKTNVDIVFSSCSYAAKFVSKPKNGLHICYLHSVPKFLWGYETETPDLETLALDKYLKPIYKKLLPPVKNLLRKKDYDAAQKVDFFIANSNFTKDRIKKHYNRDSVVIYPPVDVKKYEGEVHDGGYFLIISRLSEFKRIGLVVEAFNKIKKPLKIMGEGQDMKNLNKIAHSNIEFLGRLSEDKMVKILKRCSALIFPTEEDFGIVPVEAMAVGKPVIAYRGGGALETVIEGKTGEFFDEQTSESLLKVLKKFDPSGYNASDCILQAEKFSKERFKKEIRMFVEKAWRNKK